MVNFVDEYWLLLLVLILINLLNSFEAEASRNGLD